MSCSAPGLLKEELRDLYRLPAGHPAAGHLDAWLARACRSRIPAMLDAVPDHPCANRDDASSPPSTSACPTANSKA